MYGMVMITGNHFVGYFFVSVDRLIASGFIIAKEWARMRPHYESLTEGNRAP